MKTVFSVTPISVSLFFWGQGSEWFWVMIQSLVVIGSLLFIYHQVRLSRHSNMLQTILKFREMWSSKEMIHYRQATCKRYKKQSRAIGRAEEEVLGFFEDLGLLVENGVIPEEFVWEGYSYYIEHYWIMMKNNIMKFRQEKKDESWFERFERLAETMQKFSKKRKIPSSDITKTDIERFIKGELERIKIEPI